MEKPWLGHFDFRFDPFEHEEASSDPYLNRYLIGHEASAAAWSEAPALIFSPPGGGKTALRISASRACWTGAGGYQPFPIHYHLPQYFRKSSFSTLEDHLQKIVCSSAIALFVAFSYYPMVFLRATTSLQKNLIQFISTWLPDLEYYLEVLQTTNQPDGVASQLDKSYVLHQVPDASLLSVVCESFRRHLSDEKLPTSPSIQRVFERVATWITKDLGFRAIYVLLDGVDGFPELARSPGFAAESLVELFASSPSLIQSRVFLKGFLPLEIRNHLQTRLKDQWSTYSQVELKWDEVMLAEVIRRRVYAATNSDFASLGAVSTIPSVQDLELELAREVYLLPREMLVLVKRVLFEYEERWRANPLAEKRLTADDVTKAIAWYRVEQAPITALLASIARG